VLPPGIIDDEEIALSTQEQQDYPGSITMWVLVVGGELQLDKQEGVSMVEEEQQEGVMVDD
jgi:hypothetical protein